MQPRNELLVLIKAQLSITIHARRLVLPIKINKNPHTKTSTSTHVKNQSDRSKKFNEFDDCGGRFLYNTQWRRRQENSSPIVVRQIVRETVLFSVMMMVKLRRLPSTYRKWVHWRQMTVRTSENAFNMGMRYPVIVSRVRLCAFPIVIVHNFFYFDFYSYLNGGYFSASFLINGCVEMGLYAAYGPIYG